MMMRRLDESSLRRGVDGTVTCELSAREWGLFASSMDCRQATLELNAAVDRALATDASLAGTVYPVMAKWASYGASDSEPFNALRDIYEMTGSTGEDFDREIRQAMRGEIGDEPRGQGPRR